MGTSKNQQQANTSPRSAKPHKNNKNQSTAGGTKMGGESSSNYIFTFLVFVVGPTLSAKFPEGVERTCGFVSSLLIRVVVWLMTLKNNLLSAVGTSSSSSKNHPQSSQKTTDSYGRRTTNGGKQKVARSSSTKKGSSGNRSDLKVDVAAANGVDTAEGSDDEDRDRERKHSTEEEEEEDTASTEEDRHHHSSMSHEDEELLRSTMGGAAYRAASADMDEADLRVTIIPLPPHPLIPLSLQL